ncbi:MAG: Gfo/Idh/MocA family oxidoreductase [Actinobacteria bacterium]|nr:Gfo/Idh/MocA family oxidoreductase [Actinomycetota bacterium]
MATNSNTRLAIVGAGWAGQVHALSAATIPGVTIPVVATRSLDTAAAFAEQVNGEAFTVEELPAGADAVVIGTPPAAHAALAVRLLSAGVPVLVEKPLAATLAEADAIITAAESTGAAACYAENLLFSPTVDLALARRAKLGALDHLSVVMRQPTPDWGHFAEPLTDGGVLFDLGPHALAALVVLAGQDPVALRAKLQSSRADGADDVARVEVRFASDLIASVDVAWGGEQIDWAMQASSPTGVVRAELFPNLGVEVNGEPVLLPDPTGEIDRRVYDFGYSAQMEGFVGVLRRRGGRVCPVGFGRTILDMICAAYASAGQDSVEVPLPFPGPRDRTPMQLWRGA